jgi:RimJ/RimL family protein N-acetyltransferase
LQGQHIILEPMNVEQHAVALFDALCIHNEVSSWSYLPYGPFANYAVFETWLEKVIIKEDALWYAILNKKTKTALGISAYLRITPEHGVIEIGSIHFSPILRKTAAATEAIYLMMHYVFETLNYRRCEWKCNALNQVSCEAALRLGFTFEGVFRQHQILKNRNRDTAWFSMLDKEWPEIKVKLEKWLSPSNFDKEGKQLVKLSDIPNAHQDARAEIF